MKKRNWKPCTQAGVSSVNELIPHYVSILLFYNSGE